MPRRRRDADGGADSQGAGARGRKTGDTAPLGTGKKRERSTQAEKKPETDQQNKNYAAGVAAAEQPKNLEDERERVHEARRKLDEDQKLPGQEKAKLKSSSPGGSSDGGPGKQGTFGKRNVGLIAAIFECKEVKKLEGPTFNKIADRILPTLSMAFTKDLAKQWEPQGFKNPAAITRSTDKRAFARATLKVSVR